MKLAALLLVFIPSMALADRASSKDGMLRFKLKEEQCTIVVGILADGGSQEVLRDLPKKSYSCETGTKIATCKIDGDPGKFLMFHISEWEPPSFMMVPRIGGAQPGSFHYVSVDFETGRFAWIFTMPRDPKTKAYFSRTCIGSIS